MNDALVLWSGGCDSTLVLYDLLKEGRSVRTISITNNQIGNDKIQCRARKKIRTWFSKWIRKEFGKRGMFTSFEVNISSFDHNGYQGPGMVDNGSMVQPGLWVNIASLYSTKKEDLFVGWCRGDDIWHHRNSIFNSFGNVSKEVLSKSGSLWAPLEWTRKSEIIRRLKSIGLYDLTIWCEENDKKEPCGECVPCRTHNMNLWELEGPIGALKGRRKSR